MPSSNASATASINNNNNNKAGMTKAVPHYLHPDYLDPHTPPVDPKQSPLALLAETCNNIGKDLAEHHNNLRIKTSPSPDNDKKSESSHASPASSKKSVEDHKGTCAKRVTSIDKVNRHEPAAECRKVASCAPDTSSICSVSPLAKTRSPNGIRSPRKGGHSPMMMPRPNSIAPLKETPTKPQLPSSEPHLGSPPTTQTCVPQVSHPIYLGYPGYPATNFASWSSLFPGAAPSHPPGAQCSDPYCLQCHVTHRPCLCIQCVHQKLLSESYSSLYNGLGLLGGGQHIPAPSYPPTSPSKLSGVSAEYCMYCGKHCSTPEDLITHMQLHQMKPDTLLPPTAPPPPFTFGIYPGLDLARKISPLAGPTSPRFHPFRPPMPSRLAANISYPFGTGLV